MTVALEHRVVEATVEFRCVNGRTVASRLRSGEPLRLLSPRNHGRGAWVFASSFGGGLVAGDHIHVEVTAEEGAVGYLGTQSATKVYRCPDDLVCRQTVDAKVREGALLICWPDPVVCFAESRYVQRQAFSLAGSGSLVLLDWYTSGRYGSGERWRGAGFATANRIAVDGRCVFWDSVKLSPEDGELASGMRLGRFNCLATLVLVGPAVQAAAGELLAWCRGQAAPKRGGVWFAAGGVPAAGAGAAALLRVAGESTQEVGEFLRDRCGFVPGVLGDNPWSRKH